MSKSQQQPSPKRPASTTRKRSTSQTQTTVSPVISSPPSPSAPVFAVPSLPPHKLNLAQQPSSGTINPAVTSATSTSTAIVNPSQLNRPTMQRNVPAFLNKLYNMVDDPGPNELIRWSDDGSSFIVTRHEDFAKEVLPRFFKHNNFASFVRQLNMYGFHKVPHLQQGVLQADSEHERWEFSNPHFQRNQPDLLLLVTRKKGRDPDDKEPGSIDLNHILAEISAIKKHQMTISSDLKNIQNDNQVLWQETLTARERHQRHQETIDKILRFLASVFSSDKKRAIVNRKRRFLIGDADTEYNMEQAEDTGGSSSDREREHRVPIEELDYEQGDENGTTAKRSTNGKGSGLGDSNGLFDMQSLGTTDPNVASNYDFLNNLQALLPMTSTGAYDALSASASDLNLMNFNPDHFDPIPLPASTPALPTSSPSSANALLHQSSPSLRSVTNNIVAAGKSAESITHDINLLESNIENIANQLGFDPNHVVDDLEFVDMDDFLSTYAANSYTAPVVQYLPTTSHNSGATSPIISSPSPSPSLPSATVRRASDLSSNLDPQTNKVMYQPISSATAEDSLPAKRLRKDLAGNSVGFGTTGMQSVTQQQQQEEGRYTGTRGGVKEEPLKLDALDDLDEDDLDEDDDLDSMLNVEDV